jgi:hypothetical protein
LESEAISSNIKSKVGEDWQWVISLLKAEANIKFGQAILIISISTVIQMPTAVQPDCTEDVCFLS